MKRERCFGDVKADKPPNARCTLRCFEGTHERGHGHCRFGRQSSTGAGMLHASSTSLVFTLLRR